MPVVVVTAPPLPDPSGLPGALSAVASAVADALSLRPSDVVVTAVSTQATVVGDETVSGWPVIVLHGSPRDPRAMRDAERGARAAVGCAWAAPDDHIWSQWLIRPSDEP